MKKNICKIKPYIIIIVTAIVVFIYICCEKNRDIENNVVKESWEKQEDVVNEKEIENENNIVERDDEEMELTKEYVCNEFGIDESEFEGVDFEEFVDYYDLSYYTIHKEAVAYLLKRYKEDYGKIKIPDYSYIYNYDKDIRLTKENQESIAIVFFSNTLELSNDYYIFDFEIEKILVGSGFESHISENDIVGETNNVIKDKIIELFDKYDVYSWKVPKQRNDDIYGTEDGYTSWSLGIQFNDGTIWGLTGELINGDDAPEDLDLFVEDLKALAISSEDE